MAGSVILSILSTFNSKGTSEAQQSLNNLSKSVSGMTKHLVAGYGAWRLYGAGIDFIKSSVAAANDLQRAQNGLQTVFGTLTPVMQQYVSQSEKIGLSHAEVARSSSLVGALFRNLNFPMAQTAKQTQAVITRSADLASTLGGSTSDAIMAVTSAFKGIYRPLEKYGIGISAQMIKTELAAKGMTKLKGETLLAANMQQRFTDFMKKSEFASGAFKRQLGSLFEQEQILNSVFKDLQATIGQAMLQPLGALTEVMITLSQNIGPHLIMFFDVLANVLTGGTGNWVMFANSIMSFIDSISVVIASFGPTVLFLIQAFAGLLAPIIAVTTAVKIGTFSYTLMTAVMTLLTKARLKYIAVTAVETEAVTASSIATSEDTAIMGYLTGATEAATVATEEFSVALASTGIGAIAVGIGVLTAGLLGLSAAAGNALVNGPSKAAEKVGRDALSAARIAYQNAQMEEQITGKQNTLGINTGKPLNEDLIYNRAVAAATAKEKKAAAKKIADGIAKSTADAIKTVKDAMGAAANANAVNPLVKAADAIRTSFSNASKAVSDSLAAAYKSIAGAFDITQMGFSSDVISQNMNRFLDRLKTFQGYLKQLRGMGLDQTLYNQIAAAGPINGLAVAQAFAGSPDLIGQANTTYAGVGSIAQDIAKSTLNAAQQNIYNISVDGGVGSGTTIGKGIVEAIRAYERTNGKGWRSP